MIIGYVGTPGSGKTYEAVKTILANLKSGRRVYTNIDGLESPDCRRLIQDSLALDDYEFNKRLVFLDKVQTKTFWTIVKDGSMIVLDEVHKDFSNRDWNTAENKVFADWASTHRHHGFDLILITQDIEKVEKHVRSLIEWTYFFRKVNFFGGAVSNKYMCYSYSGDDHQGKPLASSVRTYNKFVFACYKSFVTKDTKELGFMSHVNILKHPVFFILPFLLIFAGYMLYKSSFFHGDMFGAKSMQAKMQSRVGGFSKPGKPLIVPPAAAPAAPGAVPGAPVPPVPAAVPPGLPSAGLPPLPDVAPRPSYASNAPIQQRISSGYLVPFTPRVADPFGAPSSKSRPMTAYVWRDDTGQPHLTNIVGKVPRSHRRVPGPGSVADSRGVTVYQFN